MSARSHIISIFSVVFLSSLIGCAPKSPHVGETTTTTEVSKGVTLTQTESRRVLPSGKIAGSESSHIQAEAVVDAIDYKSRKMVLTSPGADPVTLVAGPEVRNFAQIHAGDKISAEYLLALEFEVRQPTAEELAASGQSLAVGSRAALGEMPSAGVVRGAVKVATVEAIDTKANTVTLKGLTPSASTLVKAKYPENLALVKVGDSVVVTSVEGVATSVSRVN